jgi:hypothetical protein
VLVPNTSAVDCNIGEINSARGLRGLATELSGFLFCLADTKELWMLGTSDPL